MILDMIGNRSFSDCRRALTPRGTYALVGGNLGRMPQAVLLSPFVRQKLTLVLAKSTKEDLTILREHLGAGTVTPVIDRRYPLHDVPEAIRYLEEGHARGKVVITMESSA